MRPNTLAINSSHQPIRRENEIDRTAPLRPHPSGRNVAKIPWPKESVKQGVCLGQLRSQPDLPCHRLNGSSVAQPGFQRTGGGRRAPHRTESRKLQSGGQFSGVTSHTIFSLHSWCGRGSTPPAAHRRFGSSLSHHKWRFDRCGWRFGSCLTPQVQVRY